MISKLSPFKYYIFIGAFLITAMVGWYKGSQHANNKWEALRAKAVVEESERLDELRGTIAELQSKILTAKSKREVRYIERIKEVPTYIDSGNCTVNEYGMRELADALRPSNDS